LLDEKIEKIVLCGLITYVHKVSKRGLFRKICRTALKYNNFTYQLLI
jgi:hypothetical protein